MAAIIRGTKKKVVTQALEVIPNNIKEVVKEVTYDLANSMEWIVTSNFINAVRVSDRFHVQKVVNEGVQEIRIAARRKAIDEENAALQAHRKMNQERKKITMKEEFPILLCVMLTGKLRNNYWPEAVIFFVSHQRNGQKNIKSEVRFYLNIFQNSKKAFF